MACYCEICGKPVTDSKMCRRVVVDGATLVVCPQCYDKLVRQGRVERASEIGESERSEKRVKQAKTTLPLRVPEVMYEVVEDYATRIKQAREKLGWSQAVLAQKLRVGENVVKRIEAGRLKPSLDLARRIEKILGIKLLEPVVEESISTEKSSEDYLTVGDVIRLKDSEKRG